MIQKRDRSLMPTITVALCAMVVLFFLSSIVSADTNSVPKIAIISNGNYSDFGYNYMVTIGVSQMQANLSTTAGKFFQDIETPEGCLQLMEELIAEGYTMLISVTSHHKDCGPKIATAHPDIVVVHRDGTFSGLPNAAVVKQSTQESYFLQGYWAGLMSPSGKVGMVVPGSKYDKATSTNAFVLGMQQANPDSVLHTVWIESFLSPDDAYGAALILLDQVQVDILGQIQDDLTVPALAIDRGMLSIGTNGFPARTLFGENVGISLEREWSRCLIFFVDKFLRGAWDNSSYTLSFKSGSFALDYSSHLNPPDVKDKLANYTSMVIKGWKPWNPPKGSIYENDSTIDLPGVQVWGVYHVPTFEIKLPSGATKTLMALAIICIISVVIYIPLSFGFWRARVIRAASPIFCLEMQIGGVATIVSVFCWIASPTPQILDAAVWLLVGGWSITFSNLLSKNYRIYRIWTAGTTKVLSISNNMLHATAAVQILVDIVLLILFSASGDAKPFQNYDVVNRYDYRLEMDTNSAGRGLLISMLVYKLVQIFAACFLSFKLRVVNIPEFSESAPIAVACYGLAIGLVMAIPSIISVTDYHGKIVVLCFITLATATFAQHAVFVPKFWSIYREGPRWVNPEDLRSKGSGNTSTTDNNSPRKDDTEASEAEL